MRRAGRLQALMRGVNAVMSRVRIVVASVVILLVCAVAANAFSARGSAVATDPIIGDWQAPAPSGSLSNVTISVSPSASGGLPYAGKLVSATSPSCNPTPGTQYWTITARSGTSYTGTGPFLWTCSPGAAP